MPGLVDTHIHAPQYKITGTGYDKTLLDWLDTYTIPTEITFEDVEVARKIYPTVVVSVHLKNILFHYFDEQCRVSAEGK